MYVDEVHVFFVIACVLLAGSEMKAHGQRPFERMCVCVCVELS